MCRRWPREDRAEPGPKCQGQLDKGKGIATATPAFSKHDPDQSAAINTDARLSTSKKLKAQGCAPSHPLETRSSMNALSLVDDCLRHFSRGSWTVATTQSTLVPSSVY